MQKSWIRHNLKLHRFEVSVVPQRFKLIAGLDESGRGPLAGPVVASAVVLRKSSFKMKIFDCKALSFSQRQKAFGEIVKQAWVGIGIVDREIIDAKNILQATIIAMRKSITDMNIKPEYLLIDGRFKQKDFVFPSKAVIKGDRLCLSIACASIVAKVVRDNLMSYYHRLYPEYGFNRHRGYGTKKHIQAIRKYGLTAIHRLSFRPISEELNSLKVYQGR